MVQFSTTSSTTTQDGPHNAQAGKRYTWCSDLEAVTNKMGLHLAGAETLKLILTRWGYTWRRDIEADTNKMRLLLEAA